MKIHNKLCKSSLPLAFAFIAVATLILPARAQQAQSNLPVCPLIATGGTIAMKIDPVKQAPVPAISGEDLLATVPEVANHARVEVKNVSNVPSDYMDPPRWIALTKEVTATLARPDVSGVIISHGTDTLEETAWWLDPRSTRKNPLS
jgi:L-asparaginase